MITVDEFHKKYNRLPTEIDPDWHREVHLSNLRTKVKVVDAPLMSPGKCLECGAVKSDRRYIDTGVDLDITPNFVHVPYLCEYCVKEMASALGFIRIEEDKSASIIATAINDLMESIEELRNELDSVVTWITGYDTTPEQSDPDVSDDSETKSVDSGNEGTELRDFESEQGSAEPDTVGGSSSIPSLDELISFGGPSNK